MSIPLPGSATFFSPQVGTDLLREGIFTTVSLACACMVWLHWHRQGLELGHKMSSMRVSQLLMHGCWVDVLNKHANFHWFYPKAKLAGQFQDMDIHTGSLNGRTIQLPLLVACTRLLTGIACGNTSAWASRCAAGPTQLFGAFIVPAAAMSLSGVYVVNMERKQNP